MDILWDFTCIFNKEIQEWKQTQACCHDHSGNSQIYFPEKIHKLTHFSDIIFADGLVKTIYNCRTNPQIRKREDLQNIAKQPISPLISKAGWTASPSRAAMRKITP